MLVFKAHVFNSAWQPGCRRLHSGLLKLFGLRKRRGWAITGQGGKSAKRNKFTTTLPTLHTVFRAVTPTPVCRHTLYVFFTTPKC